MMIVAAWDGAFIPWPEGVLSIPLQETAANFICASPLALLIWLVVPDGFSPTGAALAAFSGAITSGMGYALWYSILPQTGSSTAALAQLTVPVIALAASVVLLANR